MCCSVHQQKNKSAVLKKQFHYGLLFLLFFFMTGLPINSNAAVPETAARTSASQKKPHPIRYLTVNGRRYMNMRDVAAYYHLKFSFNKKGAVMYNGVNKRIEFIYNKRSGSINGVNVTFLFPMLIRQNNAYLSELDFQKILEPVLKEKVYRKHQLKTIMIDPGHGGSDPGACGLKKHEKEINLEVAVKLQKALEQLGFNVIMTRSNDKNLSLQNRAAHCQKVKPDLYISLHCNSAENKKVTGIETF